MFAIPEYTPAKVLFTAVGVMIFWSIKGRTKLKAYALSEAISHLPINEKMKYFVEFITFLVLGCLVGIAVGDPTTAPQAITAGLAWTGVVSNRRL